MATERDFSRIRVHIDQPCRECGGDNIYWWAHQQGIEVPEEMVCHRCGGYGDEHSSMKWDELVQQLVKSMSEVE
jgi:hypothetical protein